MSNQYELCTNAAPGYNSAMDNYRVAALYRFVAFPDYEEWREPLLEICAQGEVKGTLLLAPEGINGTIAGPQAGVEALLAYLRQDERFSQLETKDSNASAPPFARMKVKLKREIVTMGVPDIDPTKSVGTYIAPENWNKLLEDPDVLVIDTRNEYEVGIGTFHGAIDPKLRNFRAFPEWLRAELKKHDKPKVAMFCTGGIRCEKSTAFLKQEGIEEVFHLQGGILKYLENIPEEESLWEGECFVFDERVSVVHGLREGNYDRCQACGDPVSQSDKLEAEFVEGVQCKGCINRTTPEQKLKFAERFKQAQLAESRVQPNPLLEDI